MPARLMKLQVSNYRALADVDLSLGPINVLFGPNACRQIDDPRHNLATHSPVLISQFSPDQILSVETSDGLPDHPVERDVQHPGLARSIRRRVAVHE